MLLFVAFICYKYTYYANKKQHIMGILLGISQTSNKLQENGNDSPYYSILSHTFSGLIVISSPLAFSLRA